MLQIYHGSGKGKTTAALGLALRARGADLSVVVIFFDKTAAVAEIASLRKLGVKILTFGEKRFDPSNKKFRFGVTAADRATAVAGLAAAAEILRHGKFRVVILDEILNCLRLKMLTVRQILTAIKKAPLATEIILTGRGLPKTLAHRADLITEFRAEKHYLASGVTARRGIEF